MLIYLVEQEEKLGLLEAVDKGTIIFNNLEQLPLELIPRDRKFN